MNESTDATTGEFQDGSAVGAAELHSRFDIPAPEVASFLDIIRVYPKGAVIIREGDAERALYMLRVGKIEIFKGTDTARDAVGTIDAVNFFGEMSMINDEPRAATIVAGSDSVVVYRIPNPNIQTILTNPIWAEMLISRLCRNLARSIEQHVAVTEEVKELRAEVERLKKG